MARIDINTLVLAFESRIAALEKNPPDKVSTGVVIKLLEQSIDELIKEHFIFLVKKDLEELIKKEFKTMKSAFIKETLKSILTDIYIKNSITDKIKKSIIDSIK
jgi:hypothetical protein